MHNQLPNENKNNNKHTYQALLAMITATAIWGFAPPIIKYTLNFLPPFTFLFYRFLIVSLVILPFMYIKLRQEKVLLSDVPALILSGLLGQASLAILFFGLQYTSSLEVAVIGIISPILTVGAAHYFFGDKINKNIKIGLIITSIGTIILAIGPILYSNNLIGTRIEQIIGNTLIVLYNLFWIGFVLWSKRLRGENSHKVNEVAKFLGIKIPRKKYSSDLITGFSFYVGLMALLPLYLLEATGKFGVKNLSPSIFDLQFKSWAGLLYMALLSSICAYGLFEWSLKYLKVTDTVIFSYISPLFTLPTAYLLLKELPTKDLLIGSAIIALGIFIAEYKKT